MIPSEIRCNGLTLPDQNDVRKKRQKGFKEEVTGITEVVNTDNLTRTTYLKVVNHHLTKSKNKDKRDYFISNHFTT